MSAMEDTNPMLNPKAMQVSSLLFASYIFILSEYEPCRNQFRPNRTQLHIIIPNKTNLSPCNSSTRLNVIVDET